MRRGLVKGLPIGLDFHALFLKVQGEGERVEAPSEEVISRQRPPDEGMIKLSMDASMGWDRGGDFRVVLRNGNGDPIRLIDHLFSCGTSENEEIEASVVGWGIKMSMEMGVKRLMV